MKKFILIILAAILSLEILTFVSISQSMRSRKEILANKPIPKLYVNSDTAMLTNRLPEKFVLLDQTSANKKTREISINDWLATSPVKMRPKMHTSIGQYFYEQTRTVNPWAAYAPGDEIMVWGIDRGKGGKYLLSLAGELKADSQDASLQIENGRATKFTPPHEGQSLKVRRLFEDISIAAFTKQTEVTIPVIVVEAGVALSDLNDMGIDELLARGQSDFSGSSSARIQNIRVGASQYNGLIIKPGEEFSFNKNLGPIDAAHGYLPELVIKPEGLTKEFGGGLCQVATTAFRAAFFSGLPITARRNHSYAVRYYEWINDDVPRAPGMDATIYPGAQDLKFVNNTPGAILIWTHLEGKRLYFDFYGTKDGREVVMDGPYPYDRRPSGAVKSKVTRVVKQNGATKEEKVFLSNYIPPKPIIQTIEYPKPDSQENPSQNQPGPTSN